MAEPQVPGVRDAGPSPFPYGRWEPLVDGLRDGYRSAEPYPHVVLEGFLDDEVARAAADEFPRPDATEWIQYVHVNERKLGKSDRSGIPPALGRLIDELSSPPFIALLERLTGIEGLLPDPGLEGGGLHQSERGGFLNVHADFTVHPHHRDWQRRLNLLLYLNPDWRDEWGGHLELWDRDMSRCVEKVAPVLNRCLVFNTDADAYHGHPLPLACPEGTTRKSLALYYFTAETGPLKVRSTEYRARPQDGLKAVAIFADKWALRAYDAAKRRLGIDDRVVSRILGLLGRRKRR